MTRNQRAADELATDPRVVAVLAAAAAPTEPGPVLGESAAVAAFHAQTPDASRRPRMLSTVTSLKAVAIAATATGVFLTGGVAAAATGSLPGAAQGTAHTVLAAVGVSVPGPNEHSAGHPDTRGNSGEHAATPGDDATDSSATPDDETTSGSSGDHGKGKAISDLATTTESTGVDKGAEISGAASGGKSHVGENGSANEPPAGAGGAPAEHPKGGGSEHAPVPVPNPGGTGTGGGAGGGHSSQGAEQAGQASGGHSADGSGNSDR